jgi:hypothetical protein
MMNAFKAKAYSASLTNTVVNIEIVGNCRYALMDVGNGNAAASYIQVFNRPAASVTLGTTAPLHSYYIPANGGRVIAFGNVLDFGGDGFSIAATTTRAGSTAPVATVDVNVAL